MRGRFCVEESKSEIVIKAKDDIARVSLHARLRLRHGTCVSLLGESCKVNSSHSGFVSLTVCPMMFLHVLEVLPR